MENFEKDILKKNLDEVYLYMSGDLELIDFLTKE